MEFQIDWNREYRTGVPEAVICARKSTAQIEAVIRLAHAAGRRLLFTRLGQAEYAALTKASTDLLDYDTEVEKLRNASPEVIREQRIAAMEQQLAALKSEGDHHE